MRCARGKSVQVRRARAERVEVCVLEGRAQQQQRARVAAHHAQLAALAGFAGLAAAHLCEGRTASRGIGAAAQGCSGRGLLVL